jgi:hypothetical protein
MTVVDAAANPDAKALLVSGRLNIAVCPQCGQGGALATPLVYHDPDKEMLLVHVPAELGLPETEQQKMIGELTNRLMSSLPAEQRKAYLLQPRTFLRLEGMIEAILEADGITPEMLAAQRAKIAVLGRLVEAPDDDARKLIVQENDDQIDYEFFQLLTFNLEMAQAEGQEEAVEQLLALRTQLLEWTTTGQEVTARNEAIASLGDDVTREDLLEKVVEAALAGEDVKVEAMIAVARPVVDYMFYQQLAARIDAADKAGDTDRMETLKALRETILELTDRLDTQMQQAAEKAAQLLREVVESDDMEATIKANIGQVDDLFLRVLASNLDAAEKTERAEDLEKLKQVSDIIMKLIQESQPPEVFFINDLLAAEYPEGTQSLLEENREMVTPTLLEFMDLVGEDLVQRDQGEIAERLALIAAQAKAMVPGVDTESG